MTERKVMLESRIVSFLMFALVFPLLGMVYRIAKRAND